MKLLEFDQWARSTLEFSKADSMDSALNGVQVGSLDADISKIIFAVDACQASFLRAREEGAEVLFVHHGIYWGFVYPLTGLRGERVRYLMNNGIALYACHLPLDRHPVLGNNAQMAHTLGLEDVEGFGDYNGCIIGCRGRLPAGEDLESIITRLFGLWDNTIRSLRFGPKEIHTVGIISGGAVYEVSQAIDAGLDLYITGDASHNIYHECREAGINVLFAGHYLTEVFGVRAMAQRVHQELGLETKFIDIPTGL